MATDPKAAARSARAYLKRRHIAQAELAGATILDVSLAVRAADGHYVIRLYDGEDLHLDLRREVEVPEAKGTVSPSGKRIYAPKSWTPSVWNSNVERIRSEAMARQDVLDWLAESAQTTNTPEAHKQAKQAIAVVEALPDTPDWFDHLPLAEVS